MIPDFENLDQQDPQQVRVADPMVVDGRGTVSVYRDGRPVLVGGLVHVRRSGEQMFGCWASDAPRGTAVHAALLAPVSAKPKGKPATAAVAVFAEFRLGMN